FLSHTFTHLYGSEKSRLKRFIARIVGNNATADELVQEAFSKLIDASHRQNIREPSAYLTRAARNLALNHLRHLQQGIEVSIDDQIYLAIADRKPSPEMEVIYRQELRRLLTALSNLPS
ncbi:RNA polymerase sigma factor, partial [Ochrobactrum sp. SFR4]|uniref:RNA polymerase sigma factor n=1 Tax=Ochrobactrum sp. SFR4 TaxID=2717368 RepID=UPI001C8CE9F6